MEQGGVGIDSPGDVVDGESVGIDGPGGSSGWSEGRCECGHRRPGGSGGWSVGTLFLFISFLLTLVHLVALCLGALHPVGKSLNLIDRNCMGARD